MGKEFAKRGSAAGAEGPCAPRPRDRIVATAQDLFHRHGIRGVGVETIAEQAGTNKMTLYRHFDSKDDLILEYLNYKGKKSEETWSVIERECPGDPTGQLYAFLDHVARFIAEDERGCDLANAAIELTEQGHPGLRVIEEFKSRQRERLVGLCGAAGATQPALLADTLILLVEGARVSRRNVGVCGPSANLVQTARGVLASFGVQAPKSQQAPKT
jgi:AcrR family transcriptional regulator